MHFTRARSFADVKVGELVVKKEMMCLLVLERTPRGWRRLLLVYPKGLGVLTRGGTIGLSPGDRKLQHQLYRMTETELMWERPVLKRRLVEMLRQKALEARDTHEAHAFRQLYRQIQRGTYPW